MRFLSIQEGSNAEVFKRCLNFYAPPPKRVVDLTHGPGKFYQKVSGGYTIIGCDVRALKGVKVRSDCRLPPFRDRMFDVAVMDTPYQFGGPRKEGDSEIGDKVMSYSMVGDASQILGLFAGDEIYRILTPDGVLIVKIMDTIEWTVPFWNHINLPQRLPSFHLYDLFLHKVYKHPPPSRHKRRRHATKVHAFYMIFSKQKHVETGTGIGRSLKEVFK